MTIGYVPMIDCAVIIAAQELGLFERHGLHVALSKEVGWATIREKLLHQELDAVHAPASLSYTIECGIGCVARHCLTAFVLSLNGSAITLSDELWRKGVRDAASLRALVEQDRAHTTYSFGAVLEFSTQNYDLRRWLRSGGIDPDRDVRIPIVPSPIIHRQMCEGHLDGYCVGEPWNSVLTQAGTGWVVAASSEIAPRQVEKVLLVLEEFAEERDEEHLALVAALIEASIWCEHPAHRAELVRLLAQPRYLDVPEAVLKNSLAGPFETGRGVRAWPDFIVFHGGHANVPDRKKARSVFNDVKAALGATPCRALRPDLAGRVFREDIYRRAETRAGPRQMAPQNESAGLAETGGPAGALHISPLSLAG